jgi:hypothetical protein
MKSSHTKLKGVSFHQKEIDNIKEGDEVILIREPDNPFDKNAVAVKTNQGIIIGHLSRELAKKLSLFIDKGIKYKCIIENITGKEIKGVNIKITND